MAPQKPNVHTAKNNVKLRAARGVAFQGLKMVLASLISINPTRYEDNSLEGSRGGSISDRP